MKIYKVKYCRYNTCVQPMMRQETDVIFRTDLEIEQPPSDRVDKIMWSEMWKQNPAWLLSHGPSTVGFQSWSSVMCDRESIEEVKVTDKDFPEDLTGEGNMLVALTFHPLLPSDMRLALKKAYERGVSEKEKQK